jgi:hypothetical protein
MDALRPALATSANTNSVRPGFGSKLNTVSWAFVSAVTIVGALVFWLCTPKRLSAAEFLRRAIVAENQRSVARVRIRMGTTACTAHLVPVTKESHDRCNLLRTALSKVRWDEDHPLSARAFGSWRDSLSQRTDQVREDAAALSLTTRTPEGLLREATLTLRLSDYVPLMARLNIVGFDPVEISEIGEPLDPAITSIPRMPAEAPSTVVIQPNASLPKDRSLDLAEVEAWSVLANAGIVDAWRARVRREGKVVQVVGIVESDSERDSIVAKLPKYPELQATWFTWAVPPGPAQQFAPQRESLSEIPALGRKWLRENLPPSQNPTEFTNVVLQLSQRILGLASTREELLRSQENVAGCMCAPKLKDLIDLQDGRLRSATAELSQTLAPLFGEAVDSHALLTLEQAHSLDTALIWIFASASPNAGSLGEETERIRSLLRL